MGTCLARSLYTFNKYLTISFMPGMGSGNVLTSVAVITNRHQFGGLKSFSHSSLTVLSQFSLTVLSQFPHSSFTVPSHSSPQFPHSSLTGPHRSLVPLTVPSEFFHSSLIVLLQFSLQFFLSHSSL